jgi:hypothetical protein
MTLGLAGPMCAGPVLKILDAEVQQSSVELRQQLDARWWAAQRLSLTETTFKTSHGERLSREDSERRAQWRDRGRGYDR